MPDKKIEKSKKNAIKKAIKASCKIQPPLLEAIKTDALSQALLVEDFRIAKSSSLPGDQEWISATYGKLFHCESWMRGLGSGSQKPTRENPLMEMEEGWGLILFEHEGFVYSLVTDMDHEEVRIFFKVPSDRFYAALKPSR